MAIRYYIDCDNFRFNNRRIITRWLRESAAQEGYSIGDVNIIFTSSDKLLEINRQFLLHDYYTDIITFDESNLDEGILAGELYIDIETVADNAIQLNITPLEELHRVVVHGIIHLCGQGDKSDNEAAVMRKKEAEKLALLKSYNIANKS